MTISIRNLLCVFGMALSGCSSVPKETFYTLNSAPAPQMKVNQNEGARYTVAIGPVHVPEIVDRPQLVVRKGANQVDVLEQHRWAQSLDAEIAQALASDLAARLPQARIGLSRDAAVQNADYRITVDVGRFDGSPTDGIVMQANWAIRATSIKMPLVGQSAVQEAVASGSYQDMVGAFSSAVAKVGEQIANGISTLPLTRAQP